MSRILKVASAVAILMTTIATATLTEESEAFAAEGLIAFVASSPAEPVTLQTLNMADVTPIIENGLAVDQTGSLGQNETVIEPALQPTEAVSEIEELPAVEAEPVAETLRELVALTDIPAELDAEQRCLAGTIYFESKGESLAGQLAVAKVVLARRDSGRFPNSVCGVVYQRSQFSFVRGGSMPAINTSSNAWRRAVAISEIAMDDSWESPVEGALFFHATHVSPRWRLKRLASVDNHVFYK